jgi:phosphocarrier protein HPr
VNNQAFPIIKDYVLLNQYGMHARPAALFVQLASRFDADVLVEKDGNKVSGKSIMGLLTLAAGVGSTLRVTATGPEAQQVHDELGVLIGKNFGEE